MEFNIAIYLEYLLPVVGIFLFAHWLLKTSLGRIALADSVPRRNSMPFFLPFAMLFFALGVVPIISSLIKEVIGDLPNWQGDFLDNLVYVFGELTAIVLIIIIVIICFPQNLRGFGLKIKTIPGDFAVAFVNLLTIWPLIMVATLLTLYFGDMFWGNEYQMQQHEQLVSIKENPELLLRVLIVFVAIVVAPLLEEMLFRGLFQTMIRSYLEEFIDGAWLSILITSVLFMSAHADYSHWPALLVLSVCLGYSYEKSGSLFRPIFIHSIFNAISVLSALGS